jgi:hypothetical protein
MDLEGLPGGSLERNQGCSAEQALLFAGKVALALSSADTARPNLTHEDHADLLAAIGALSAVPSDGSLSCIPTRRVAEPLARSQLHPGQGGDAGQVSISWRWECGSR